MHPDNIKFLMLPETRATMKEISDSVDRTTAEMQAALNADKRRQRQELWLAGWTEEEIETELNRYTPTILTTSTKYLHGHFRTIQLGCW